MAGSAKFEQASTEHTWLDPIYRNVLDTYIQGLGPKSYGGFDEGLEKPSLVLRDSEKGYDLEDNLIYVEPGALRTHTFEELSEMFLNRISHLHAVQVHSEALTERTEEAIDWLENVYDTDIDFGGAYFRDLPGNTLAKSKRSERRFRIDTGYMENFDWEEKRFERDEPVSSIDEQVKRINTLLEEGREQLEPRVSKVASTPLHEVRHWLSYELNSENLEFKNNREDIEELSGQDRSWGKDITVAPLEAETTFDQFLYGYNGMKRRKQPLKAFHDPLENTDFFEGFDELSSEHEKTGVRSPYNLGLFLGLAEYHRQRQNKPDEEALMDAREHTVELTADLEGLEQELKDYLEWRIGSDFREELMD